MSAKHTHGPWHVTSTGCVWGADSLVAAVYGDDPECKKDDRMIANARLIAAAPDLLSRMKWAIWELSELDEATANMVAALLQEAVDKATGESS